VYARVARFEDRDTSLTDELIQRARQSGPASVPDAKGFIGLVDRERGSSLSITFFDSEDAIRNSEQAFEDMAKQFPAEMRGQRKSVDVYEVSIFEGDAESAKAVRVSTLEGSPDKLDESLEMIKAETVPQLRSLPGNVGMIGLADRSSGRTIAITLWDSDDALRQTEEQANRMREQAAESGDAQISSVERYEVGIVQELSQVRA
jgi:heme-degrading monooxygenase HmoA